MPAAPDLTPLTALSASLAGVVGSAAASVVSVHSHRALSSGFAWKPSLIVTADEALADEGEVAVTLAGGDRVRRPGGRPDDGHDHLLGVQRRLLVRDQGRATLGVQPRRDGRPAAEEEMSNLSTVRPREGGDPESKLRSVRPWVPACAGTNGESTPGRYSFAGSVRR